MADKKQLNIMKTIKKAAALLQMQIDEGKVDKGLLMDLQALVEAGARQMDSPAPVLPASTSGEEIRAWLTGVEQWQGSLAVPEKAGPPQIQNETDKVFYGLMAHVKGKPLEELADEIKDSFMRFPQDTRERYMAYLRKYPYWGQLDVRKGDYSIIENRARTIKEHREDFLWLYGRLSDYRSKNTLLAILCNWCTHDLQRLENTKETLYGDYFDLDIFPYGRDEVFVDLGAYIGDTALEYMRRYGGCRKMYCYEITDTSFVRLQRDTAQYSQIECRKKGVSDHHGTMFVTQNDDRSANMLTDSAHGKTEVEVVALDEDITEPVTFIKMDIEGAEQAALRGAAGHIRRSHPKLAICTYHNNEDIWKIPRMIDEIQPGYCFYMRHNGGNMIPSEYVLLAVWKGAEGSRSEL